MDRGNLVTLGRILAEERFCRQAKKFDGIKAKRYRPRISTVLPQPHCLHTILRIVYSDSAMWNVNEWFEKKAIDSLAALGFGVGSTRGVVRVEKYGSGAEFRQEPDGRFRMTVLLWDAGCQKF